jgi:hypothetical protein
MRILLATAVALAPLTIAAGAQAQVVISNARTTPISTSNATGTAADSIRLASGGSIAVSSGAAITIDSSNSVVTEAGGNISLSNAADGATGILVNGGNTADLTIGGQVIVSDSITDYPDSDNDGDLDGPFAAGTNRYGVRIAGAAPVTGNVTLQTSGVIQVEGNDSFGIANEAGIRGNLQSLGTVRVVGDRTRAISSTGNVSGNLIANGSVSATGGAASGIVVQGDVGGRLSVQGEVSSTGYRYTVRGTDTFVEGLEPEDRLQSGSAVVVAGNVGSGVVFDAPPADRDPANADEDGDGTADAAETTATINTFGQAPAVAVGSDSRAITLGVAGTGDNAYGFINRGAINGQGVYKDVSANGVRFGTDSGQGVTINGGILNTGTIAALALEADATAVRVGQNVVTPVFNNAGAITAGTSSEGVDRSTAIRIDAGASLPALINSGSILATTGGSASNVTAILDSSGTLSSVTNTGSIQANISPSSADAPVTGMSTALDLRANSSGVRFLQDGVQTSGDDFDDADNDGVSDDDEPILLGDVYLGSGADIMDIRNGIVIGDIAFGSGADRLDISGGGLVRGALSDMDGQLAINVLDGTLEAQQAGTVNATGLTVGAEGNLIVTVDPASGSNGGFRVNGAATLADGAGLGIRFSSLLDEARRFTIIDADTLSYGAIDPSGVQDNSPYLFVVNAGADIAAGDVYIDARRRTAQEAELIAVEQQAFESFYASLDDNPLLLNAFLSQTDRDGFINLYEQMLPDHSGGPLLSLASGVDAVTRALTGRNASAGVGETSAWVQEINFYADKDKTDTYGFRSEGFGIAGGVERGTGLGAVGVSLAFTSSDLEDPEAEAEEVLSASLVELGLYWRAQGRNWTTWARAAAGYASFDATRALVDEGLNLSNESQWHGFTLAAAAGASYQRDFGRLSVRPEAYVEYFGLSEEDRVEEGGGDGFDLEIDERDGHLFSAVAAVNVGYGFGENGWLRPELRLGWRQNISVDPGETIARFASGGPDFRLTPDSIEGGGPIAGLRLGVGNELGMLSIAADAEMIEDYVRYTLLLRASFRF